MAHLGQLSTTTPSVLYLQTSRMEAAKKLPDMTFTAEDLIGVVLPNSDPLVLLLHIAGQRIHRVLVDGGSGVNIL